jgi:hypothetical protein|tara:strand:+ start:124 stop:303 length:180 start_codon:yes stop_codon:yes gene_type:complete
MSSRKGFQMKMHADAFLNPLVGQMAVNAHIVIAQNPIYSKAHPLNRAHMNAHGASANLQ